MPFRSGYVLSPAARRIALGTLVAFAAVLRFHHLGHESLWLDEGFSLRVARSALPGVIAGAIRDIHPPLFYLSLHRWIAWFGDSEAASRAMSAVVGVLSVVMIYRVGRVLFDPEVGLLAALLLTVSPFHLRYAQEARSYALLTLTTLASYETFIHALRRGGVWRHAAYVVCTTLLVYTHHFGWFVVLAQNVTWIAVLLAGRGTRLSGRAQPHMFGAHVLDQIAIVLLYLPWVNVLLHQTTRVQQWTYMLRPGLRSLASTLVEYAGSPYMLVLFIVLAGMGLLTPARTRVPERGRIRPGAGVHERTILLPWLVVPVALPFVISWFSSPVYVTKATVAASLVVVLLAARGLREIDARPLRAAVLGLIALLVAPLLVQHFGPLHKERWRDAARDLEAQARPGDLVLVTAGYCLPNVFDYYARRRDLEKRGFPEHAPRVDSTSLDELDQRVRGHDRVWVVVSHGGDDLGLIPATLARDYDTVLDRPYPSRTYELWRAREYVGVEVRLFERRAPAVSAASGRLRTAGEPSRPAADGALAMEFPPRRSASAEGQLRDFTPARGRGSFPRGLLADPRR